MSGWKSRLNALRVGVLGGVMAVVALRALSGGAAAADARPGAGRSAGEWDGASVAVQDTSVLRYVVAPEGNEARYRVREQLARLSFPNDAVGVTSGIEGEIRVRADGTIVQEASRFTVDLASLKSDSDRRDNYVRRRTLETEAHPSAVFVPRAFQGLTFPLPAAGDVSFRLVGDLTIRGVTRPVTWEVTAKVDGGVVSGQATTRFTFDDFELTKPRVASVLSVEDDIRLEYDFRLVPAAGAADE